MRPWNKIPIKECGESLEIIYPEILCLRPHPYYSIGAPYLNESDPFKLRIGVLQKLLEVQEFLKTEYPDFRIAVFDAWRPIAVQKFMVEHVIDQECKKRGLDRNNHEQVLEVNNAIIEVCNFWATPSCDPSTPPPHSTGGALDITLVDLNNLMIFMGGEIDDIDEHSKPQYYADEAKFSIGSKEWKWNQRRCLLADIMKRVGFVQHPNEWWHFSFGDQLWAWQTNSTEAIYGEASF